jgi:Tol biopolymer transport system component
VPAISPARVLLESRDNRFAIRNPAWSPDGETIVFERVEESPEGARLPAGLWAVPSKGGEPRRLVRGMVTNPLFSPDGRFLLYQSGNDLMRYDWKTGEVLNLTGGKGLNRYASWSPVLKRK